MYACRHRSTSDCTCLSLKNRNNYSGRYRKIERERERDSCIIMLNVGGMKSNMFTSRTCSGVVGRTGEGPAEVATAGSCSFAWTRETPAERAQWTRLEGNRERER
jgi:hypothetical protein